MELVLVERRFAEPVDFEDIQALEDLGSSCLDSHGVRFLKTFFSRDRRRMLCLYEAPDAEAVRVAENQAKVPYERAWTCEHIQGGSHSDESSPVEYVVAERLFQEPVTRALVFQVLEGASPCLGLHGAEYVESFLGRDGLRMVCLFRAPDAETIRSIHRQGGLPYTDIWTASLHGPR